MDHGGLKYIFPSFMGKGNKHILRKKSEYENVIEEHMISIIDNLFSFYDNKNPNFSRLISKFVENNFEKTDRLIDLFNKYWNLVSKVDASTVEDTLKENMTVYFIYIIRKKKLKMKYI